MMRAIYILFSILLLPLLGCPSEKQARSADTPPTSNATQKFDFRQDGVLEFSRNGAPITSFDIEIVASHADRAQGLMFREKMEDNQAMLFIFEEIDLHAFWMQNTYLPLDMIFIDQFFRVVHIEKNTVPFNEEVIVPDVPALYVLETKAGMADKYKLNLGDTVKWTRNSD